MTAKENPFASRQIEGLAFEFPDGLDWSTLLERLRAMRWRGAIVGPHGSGKTTLLEQLAHRLEGLGFFPAMVTLREGSNSREFEKALAVASRGAPALILLDGCEQLSPLRWLRLRFAARDAAGLVITQHHPGRLPTALETRSSAELLTRLTHELSGVTLNRPDASRLLSEHQGNIRECFRELYDRVSVSGGHAC